MRATPEKTAASAAGLKRFFTGAPCRAGHVAERLVSNGMCVVCHNAQTGAAHKRRRAKNPPRRRCTPQEYYQRYKETRRRYAEANKERLAEYRKEWSAANPDLIKAKSAKWRRANPDKVRAFGAKRRADKFRATPKWADRAAITAIYAKARELSAAGEEPLHVDHTIPLNSPIVCGLHVHWNLQILSRGENIRKGNRVAGVGVEGISMPELTRQFGK